MKRCEIKIARFSGLLLFVLVLAISWFLISGCGRKEEKPHKLPEVRSPDISTAIEIPEVPYPVIPNELVVLLKKEKTLKSFSESLKDRDSLNQATRDKRTAWRQSECRSCRLSVPL